MRDIATRKGFVVTDMRHGRVVARDIARKTHQGAPFVWYLPRIGWSSGPGGGENYGQDWFYQARPETALAGLDLVTELRTLGLDIRSEANGKITPNEEWLADSLLSFLHEFGDNLAETEARHKRNGFDDCFRQYCDLVVPEEVTCTQRSVLKECIDGSIPIDFRWLAQAIASDNALLARAVDRMVRELEVPGGPSSTTLQWLTEQAWRAYRDQLGLRADALLALFGGLVEIKEKQTVIRILPKWQLPNKWKFLDMVLDRQAPATWNGPISKDNQVTRSEFFSLSHHAVASLIEMHEIGHVAEADIANWVNRWVKIVPPACLCFADGTPVWDGWKCILYLRQLAQELDDSHSVEVFLQPYGPAPDRRRFKM